MNFINLGFLSFVLSNNSFFRYGSRDDWGGRRKVDAVLTKWYRSSTALTKTSPTFDQVDPIAATFDRLLKSAISWKELISVQLKASFWTPIQIQAIEASKDRIHQESKTTFRPVTEKFHSNPDKMLSSKHFGILDWFCTKVVFRKF